MNKILGNYIIKEELGSGQFGSVYHAYDLKTNEEFAIKTINISRLNTFPKMLSLIKNEINVLSKIDNPNIIKLKEFIQSTNNFYLVYEYCNGGTLEDYINKKKKLSEQEGLYFFEQIINGFKSLFLNKVLHRDLKPANILLHNGIIKIADFGFCKPLENNFDLTQTMVGSPIYMAPEILKGDEYNIKADIWSMGVVLFEMLFGFCPYEDKTIYRLLNQINLKPLTIPFNINKITKKTEELLFKLLVVNPQQRIEWIELLTIDFDCGEKEKGKEIELEKIESYGEIATTSRTRSFNEKSNIDLKNYHEFIKEKNQIVDLRHFLKERNKNLLILNTIETLLKVETFDFFEKNEKYSIVNYLFDISLKIYDDLINEMAITIKRKESFIEDQLSDVAELKVFLQTIRAEQNELENTLKLFRKENKIVEYNNNHTFIKSTLEILFLKLKEQLDDDVKQIQTKKNLIVATLLVDCLQINEIFALFFETNSKYSDQTYFKSLEYTKKEDLLYLFIKKKNLIHWG